MANSATAEFGHLANSATAGVGQLANSATVGVGRVASFGMSGFGSRAVNFLERKTGLDLDRDGDVGVGGRATAEVGLTANFTTTSSGQMANSATAEVGDLSKLAMAESGQMAHSATAEVGHMSKAAVAESGQMANPATAEVGPVANGRGAGRASSFGMGGFGSRAVNYLKRKTGLDRDGDVGIVGNAAKAGPDGKAEHGRGTYVKIKRKIKQN